VLVLLDAELKHEKAGTRIESARRAVYLGFRKGGEDDGKKR
jgi:hypothetical protein